MYRRRSPGLAQRPGDQRRPGEEQLLCGLADATGRMITDMFVVNNDADTLLEVPAPLAAALAQRLDGLIFTEDARVADVSADVLPLEVCGPGAEIGLDPVKTASTGRLPVPVRLVDHPVGGAVLYCPAASVGRRHWKDWPIPAPSPLDDATAEILRVEAGTPAIPRRHERRDDPARSRARSTRSATPRAATSARRSSSASATARTAASRGTWLA